MSRDREISLSGWLLFVLAMGICASSCSSNEGAGSETGGTVDAGADGCVKAGDECPGGRCIAASDALVCAPPCSSIDDPCNCGSISGKCYPVATGNYCLCPGTKAPGEKCGAATECISGATCLDQGDDDMECYLVCADDSGCDGSTCTDTTLGFSVCSPN